MYIDQAHITPPKKVRQTTTSTTAPDARPTALRCIRIGKTSCLPAGRLDRGNFTRGMRVSEKTQGEILIIDELEMAQASGRAVKWSSIASVGGRVLPGVNLRSWLSP